MGVSFRRMTVSDLPAVMEMNSDFRAEMFAEEAAVRFLENPDNWLFAAVDDGKIVGFAYGYSLQRIAGGRMLYVHEVGVAESRQRKGIGTRMLKAMFSACRESGIGKCFLTTYRNNAGANALYRKLGGGVSPESCGDDTVYWFRTGDFSGTENDDGKNV